LCLLCARPPSPAPLRTPKTQRAKRILQAREPLIVENVKSVLGLRGPKCSQIAKLAIKDFCTIQKPHAKALTRENPLRPFEDQTSLEFLARQNDCSLLAFGSHTKKRPHNFIIGRLFDFQVLDMFEFGIDSDTFRSLKDLEGERKGTVRVGSKPCFVFSGEEFEKNPDFVVLKSLLLDFFRGEQLDQINLAGVDRVIAITARADKVYFRHYAILLKKSGTKIPRVELEEVGPTMDLTFRRRRSAAEEVQKDALRQPKATSSKPRPVKNLERSATGDARVRVHLQHQDLDELTLARMKGLKRKQPRQSEEAAGDAMDTDADTSSNSAARTEHPAESANDVKEPSKKKKSLKQKAGSD